MNILHIMETFRDNIDEDYFCGFKRERKKERGKLEPSGKTRERKAD